MKNRLDPQKARATLKMIKDMGHALPKMPALKGDHGVDAGPFGDVKFMPGRLPLRLVDTYKQYSEVLEARHVVAVKQAKAHWDKHYYRRKNLKAASSVNWSEDKVQRYLGTVMPYAQELLLAMALSRNDEAHRAFRTKAKAVLTTVARVTLGADTCVTLVNPPAGIRYELPKVYVSMEGSDAEERYSSRAVLVDWLPAEYQMRLWLGVMIASLQHTVADIEAEVEVAERAYLAALAHRARRYDLVYKELETLHVNDAGLGTVLAHEITYARRDVKRKVKLYQRKQERRMQVESDAKLDISA